MAGLSTRSSGVDVRSLVVFSLVSCLVFGGCATSHLADPAPTASQPPTAVALAGDSFGTCAWMSDGVIQCWGRGVGDARGLRPSLLGSLPAGPEVAPFDLISGSACTLTGDGQLQCACLHDGPRVATMVLDGAGPASMRRGALWWADGHVRIVAPCQPSVPQEDLELPGVQDIQVTGVDTIWALRGREVGSVRPGEAWLSLARVDRDYSRMLMLGGLNPTVVLWDSQRAIELTSPISGGDAIVAEIAGPSSVATIEGANDEGMRCALTDSGVVWCWGANGCDVAVDPGAGPAVPNDCVAVDLPPAHARMIALPSPASDLAVGFYHACALTSDGAVWCWGSNYRGQLGDGTAQDSMSPVRLDL